MSNAKRPDHAVLLESKQILDPEGHLNWSPDLPMEGWDGVTVRGSQVLALHFSDLAEAEDFEEYGVEAANDRLLLRGGCIPPTWGQLDALQVLCIDGTGLEGSIPPELGDCPELVGLQITENNVDAEIPPELGRCSKLCVLKLDCLEGQAGGTIPPELGNCAELEHLNLSAMALSGEVPPELANCSHLKTLTLRENDLTGAIPAELGALQELEVLDLNENQLIGPLPPSLGGNKPLRKLLVRHNDLTGSISESFGDCYALDTLAIAGSGLSGALPDELATRARPEASRAEDQAPTLAQMTTNESLAYVAAEWLDNSVVPLFVELGAMEPTFRIDAQRSERWPAPVTRDNPARVYVDDEPTLEATRSRQADEASLGM